MDTQTLKILKPFDSHVHFRQGAMLKAVVPETAKKFAAAIVMPNTVPPIETVEQAAEYKKEILGASRGSSFEPLMTFYLTKKLSPVDIEQGFSGAAGTKIYAVKSYPYGATTNSQWGYENVLDAKDVLKKMEEVGMPLLLHGEVHTGEHGEQIDPYEGERVFIEEILPRLLESYPKLKISLEHLSSKVAADFIEKNGQEGRLVATVTPHHLLYSRDDAESDAMLRCKPLIKSAADREVVRILATKGLPFISAGSDSAPHPESKKRSPEGAFGIFTAPTAIELYAQVFDEMNALDPLDKLGASKLEGFLSINGPRFFGIEPSSETIALEKKDWQIAESLDTPAGEKIVPMNTGTMHWKMV